MHTTLHEWFLHSSSGTCTIAYFPNTDFQGNIEKCSTCPICLRGACRKQTTGLASTPFFYFFLSTSFHVQNALVFYANPSIWFFFEFVRYSFDYYCCYPFLGSHKKKKVKMRKYKKCIKKIFERNQKNNMSEKRMLKC